MVITFQDPQSLTGATPSEPVVFDYSHVYESAWECVDTDGNPIDISALSMPKWTLDISADEALSHPLFHTDSIAPSENAFQLVLAVFDPRIYGWMAGNVDKAAFVTISAYADFTTDVPSYRFTMPCDMQCTSTFTCPGDLQRALLRELQAAVQRASDSAAYASSAASDVIDTGIVEIRAQADRASGYADSAEQSSVDASDAATAAEEHASDAQSSANAAAAAASNANVAAESASTSALSAQGYSTQASGYSDTAASHAASALQSSQQAATSAEAAASSEVWASDYADNASDYAANASAAATAAQGHASAASASAQAATVSAQSASADASVTSDNKDAAIVARNDAVSAKDAAAYAQVQAETAQTKAEQAQVAAEAAAAKIPEPTLQDAGKVPAVNQQGTAYELKDISQLTGISGVSVNGVAAPVEDGVAQVSAVTDVTVDGQSVVENGVATITIPASAQADWDESDTESPAYIKNKPDVVTQDEVGVADGVAGLDANALVPRAQLPKAGNGAANTGAVYGSTTYGIQFNSGRCQVDLAKNTEIDNRDSQYKPIVPSNLDYAVRSVLPNVTVIPAASTAYSLLDASATTNNHSWQYTHTPDAATTYTFPAVTDTAVAHRIKLTIDFTTVQTYSFLDANGDAIVPLFTPSISAGDVYEFRCEYSTVQSRWLIYPCKQGAVADDFVMRGEVGAANGVAQLDSNGKVPNAEIPIVKTASNGGIGSPGGVTVDNRVNGYRGIALNTTTGEIQVVVASDANISARSSAPVAKALLVPEKINYAVTAALTDANKIQLTDAQKASAQDTLGVGAAPIVASGAPTTSTPGAVGQFAVDTVNHKVYSCEAITNTGTEETPVYEYTWREYVLLNSGGKVDSAVLPMAGANADKCGAVWATSTYGISMNNNGRIQLVAATASGIDNRRAQGVNGYGALTPVNLDYAVRSVSPKVTTIPAATSAYSLLDVSATTNDHSCTYRHAPESAPTYTLPAVTNTAIEHEIILNVRFSATALSADFEDSEGNAITPLSTPTIVAGTEISYLCEWSALQSKWIIMPVDMGGAQ